MFIYINANCLCSLKQLKMCFFPQYSYILECFNFTLCCNDEGYNCVNTLWQHCWSKEQENAQLTSSDVGCSQQYQTVLNYFISKQEQEKAKLIMSWWHSDIQFTGWSIRVAVRQTDLIKRCQSMWSMVKLCLHVRVHISQTKSKSLT